MLTTPINSNPPKDSPTTNSSFRVIVDHVVDGRYGSAVGTAGRPLEWEKRKSGIDTIVTTEGKSYRLASDGGQSVPAKGWELMLTPRELATEYNWTLYGIPPGSEY